MAGPYIWRTRAAEVCLEIYFRRASAALPCDILLPSTHIFLYTSAFRHTSHAFRHTSRVFRHTSHAFWHTSHAFRHNSRAFQHTYHAFRHSSHIFPPPQLSISLITSAGLTGIRFTCFPTAFDTAFATAAATGTTEHSPMLLAPKGPDCSICSTLSLIHI